jgi:hypothetical protein
MDCLDQRFRATETKRDRPAKTEKENKVKHLVVFILIAVLLALILFPVWHFLIQSHYLNILGKLVALLGDNLPFGKTEYLGLDSNGDMVFGLFKIRSNVVVDVGSIVTNIIPLLALVLATPVSIIRRILGALGGIGIGFLSHLVAVIIILLWQSSGGARGYESMKIFTDGLVIAALPLFYWAVWADAAKKGGIAEILKWKK